MVLSLTAGSRGLKTALQVSGQQSIRSTFLEVVVRYGRTHVLQELRRYLGVKMSECPERRFRHSPRTWAFRRVAREWDKPTPVGAVGLEPTLHGF